MGKEDSRIEPYLLEEKRPLLFVAKERFFRLEFNKERTEARFMAVRLDELSFFFIRKESVDPEKFKSEDEFTEHMIHVIEQEYDEAVAQGYLFPWYFLIASVHFVKELNGEPIVVKDNGDKETLMSINEDMRKHNAFRLSENDSFFKDARIDAEERFGYYFALYKWIDEMGRENHIALPWTTPV